MGNIWHDITRDFSSVGITGKFVRKKGCLFIAGAAAAVLWCRLRDKKYPLVKGYPLMNKNTRTVLCGMHVYRKKCGNQD